ncbi:hypothetical protein PIB30_010724 [Stylosanthes scabra]|uniref:BRO1 domain-containing protein n=1 Tax=Stylosanthes scabra TaxID=79078 RepID=A0ABU6X5D1_9FABA|nr:hypothetical protein [Stylosanthes scabra]
MSNDNPERVLSIPAKKSVPVELYRPLRMLVAAKYSESHAQKLEGVLETLNKCRMDMVERGDLSVLMQRNCLIHYFKCLCMVEPLFVDISADTNPIIFVWYDAFNSEHVSSQHNSIQLVPVATAPPPLAVTMQWMPSMPPFLPRTSLPPSRLDSPLRREPARCTTSSPLKLRSSDYTNISITMTTPVLLSSNMTRDSAAITHVGCFDQTLVIHLSQKARFFHAEALQRQSPESELPALVQSITLDDDAESVTEKLLRGICCLTSLLPSCRLDHDADSFKERILSYASKPGRKRPKIPYIDLLLSENCPFKIIDDGKLVVMQWDMPPPYPTNSEIFSSLSSSSSHMVAIPLKKSEPLDLYEPLRSYVVLKYSENKAKRVEDLFKMLDKLRGEMQRDDLPLLIRRDCLIRYFELLCMIECLFPMTNSPNPPIFIWYNSFNPQQHSCQHNIHLEKASVICSLQLGSPLHQHCYLLQSHHQPRPSPCRGHLKRCFIFSLKI